MVIYEDLASGELRVVSLSDAREEVAFKALPWPELEKGDTAARYLSRELGKRRIAWQVTLKNQTLAEAEAAELALLEDEGGGGGMMLMMESEDELSISAMTRTTNGLRLELTYPESFSGMVWSAYSYDVQYCPVNNSTGSGGSPGLPTNDIPEECTNCPSNVCEFETTNNFMGLEPVWQLIASNVVLTGETQTVWLDTRPMGLDAQTNPTHRFYGFGANTDSDGDGLNDGYELFVTKTDPFNEDSDGDGLPDGWEVENGLDPLSSAGDDGADGDPDGDGLSNALEAQLGLNPQSANSTIALQASSIAIERAVSGASLSKCGYSDFETGDRKFRHLAVSSQSSREFYCEGSEYLDTAEMDETRWYSPLCESNSFVGSKSETTIRNTPTCQYEAASILTWTNQYGGDRIWWVVQQSPSNCWTTESGGTNWNGISHDPCTSCVSSGPTYRSHSWTNHEVYGEDCSESWNGLYTETLTDKYTTGELVGRVQTQFAAVGWSTNWQGSGSACRDLSENETTFALSKMQIRFHIPSTSNGVAYRFSWVRVFTPEDTNQTIQVEAKTVYFAGTGGAAYVGDGPWSARHSGSSSDFYINPPASDGCVDVSILKVDLGISGVAEADEETVGGFVPVNADNDNGSTVTDRIPATRDFDASNYTDDDLVPISVLLQPAFGLSGTLRLRKAENGRDRVKIWETTGKATEVSLPKTWVVGTDAIPTTLYVEGLKEGESLRSIDLILEYIQNGVALCEDRVKATVTPVLKKLDVVDSTTLPDLAISGAMWIYSNGGMYPSGVPTVQMQIEVENLPVNPPGELRMIQHAHPENLLSGGAGVVGHDGTRKKLDYAAPHTGGTLVDSDASRFPFYDDLDSSPIIFRSEDTPGMWVGPPSLWPMVDGDSSQIDFKYNFNVFAVWQFPDTEGTVYFLGSAGWSTRIQGELHMTAGSRGFAGGTANDSIGSSGFMRDNTNQRTALPNATDSVSYMDP